MYWRPTLWSSSMRPGKTLSLTVTLPNSQHINVVEAVVRWSRGQEFTVENVAVERLLDPLTSFELLAGGGILAALASGRRHVRIRRHAWIEVMRCLGRVGIIAAFLHVLHARIHLGWRDSRNVGL